MREARLAQSVAEEIRARMQEQNSRDVRILRAIGYAGLGLLILFAIGFIAFIAWVIHETT